MKQLKSIIGTITLAYFLMLAWQFAFAGTWQDDFEDNDSCEWETLDVDWQVEKWWTDNGEAIGEIFQPGWMSLWFTGELTWENYSLSCRAKLVEAKDEPPSLGLTLHSRNREDSRYLFFIDYAFDTVRIVKANKDNWFPVVYPFDAEIDTWYELTATVYGNGTLEFKVDDEIFTVIDDDPLKGGQAGLLVADGRARFDDVEITGTNIPDSSPGKRSFFHTAVSHNIFKLSMDTRLVEVGDTFTVYLSAENVFDLAGWQTDIVFSPIILEAIEVSEGHFLKADGTNTFFQQGKIDNAIGEITGLSTARLGGGVNQSGILLAITFMAKVSGETCLALSKSQFGDSKGDVILSVPPKISILVNNKNKRLIWDINGDGEVSILDMILVAQEMGKPVPPNSHVDVNNDGSISILDLILVAQHLGESTDPAAPSRVRAVNRLNPMMIQAWIADAQAENDGSLAFQQGIKNLRYLLALWMPEKTALLPNYPNPFNPETWIPYQLTEASDVILHIYTANGTLVRTLELGYHPPGIYQSRSRAAYWDGKNATGEPVASGVYFYTLITSDLTSTRKMLIRK